MRNSVVSIGSVSHGTMREEDLIPAFISELDSIRENIAHDGARLFGELESVYLSSRIDDVCGPIEKRMQAEGYFDGEDAADDLESLFDLLNVFAPAFCSFGSHPGDGSDYGFWFDHDYFESACEDGEVLKIDAGDEWPTDLGEASYVAEITDHGNVTIYTIDHVEVIAIV